MQYDEEWRMAFLLTCFTTHLQSIIRSIWQINKIFHFRPFPCCIALDRLRSWKLDLSCFLCPNGMMIKKWCNAFQKKRSKLLMQPIFWTLHAAFWEPPISRTMPLNECIRGNIFFSVWEYRLIGQSGLQSGGQLHCPLLIKQMHWYECNVRG